MKKYELKMVERNVVTSTICNKCGEEFPQYEDGCSNGAIEHFTVEFGWGSFLDMDVFMFDLCDNCFDEFIKTFKIIPEIGRSTLN
jgi:hypothetical protein